MNRSSQSITLAILGAVAALVTAQSCNTNGCTSASSRPSGYYGGHYWGGSGRSTGGSVGSHTSRGGFGSSGHAIGS